MNQDELVTILHLKNKNKGAVFLKLQSAADDVSVVTVRANLVFGKNKLDKATPGGKGLLNYQLMDARSARVEFDPLQCPDSNKACYKDFTYSSISSDKLEGVYAQLVCPSIAFDLEDRQVLTEGHATAIHTSILNRDARISFTEAMKGDVDYVGVKAENKKSGEVVYYKPVEIATFWGQF
jgi:hypothetical protein